MPELVLRVHRTLLERAVPPGSHITAQALADQFAVSRWTASEVLSQLAQRGVVVHAENRGYYLSARIADIPVDRDLPAGRDLNAIYFKIAEDRLSGKLEESVTESFLKQRYDLTAADLSSLLNRIAAEGWIEPRAGYGWTFSQILRTPQTLEQSYRFRLLIEPAALLEPGFHLRGETIRKLRIAHEDIVAGAADTLPADVLYERGVAFHESLAEASGNPFFLDALRRINRLRRLLIYRSMVDRRRFYEQSAEHLLILELLEDGNIRGASEALRAHLEEVIRKVPPKVQDALDRPLKPA